MNRNNWDQGGSQNQGVSLVLLKGKQQELHAGDFREEIPMEEEFDHSLTLSVGRRSLFQLK